jgi:hypothetical protein
VRLGKWVRLVGVMGATLLVVAWLGAGCGGDDGGEETKGPEEYARAMCEAMGKHADDLKGFMAEEQAFEDPSELGDFLADTAPVLKGLADDLGKVGPPADIKDWHEAMVAGLSDTADLFSELDELMDKPLEEAQGELEDLFAEMENIGEPLGDLGDLPAEYQEAFDNEPKCQKLEDILGELDW